jgi:hypothetical protein
MLERRPVELRLAFVLALSLAACRPEIGDACETSTDCSPSGERLCDITQKPGGYCTIFNCEPASCPEEAVCVKFGDDRSPVAGCEDPLGAGPYARTFCLRKCEDDGDCRDRPYRCFDPERTWGAQVIDPHSKICGIPPKSEPVPGLDEPEPGQGEGDAPGRSNDVCTGDVTPSGMGGAPSDDGMAGAGG